jgi:hypothetical protein
VDLIVENFKWVLIVGGLLTCTMFYAAAAPAAAFKSTFGEDLGEGAARLVVRNWGFLIGLGGLMMIYAAFDAGARPLVLSYIVAGKAMFIGLVMSGRGYLKTAALAVVVDSILVALSVTYLVATA